MFMCWYILCCMHYIILYSCVLMCVVFRVGAIRCSDAVDGGDSVWCAPNISFDSHSVGSKDSCLAELW